jgi:hypothetical protein
MIVRSVVQSVVTSLDQTSVRQLWLCAALVTTATLDAQSPYVVGPNIQVTHADNGWSVQETSTCAHPGCLTGHQRPHAGEWSSTTYGELP